MDKQEANKQIAEKLEQAAKLVRECMVIADTANISFDAPWGGEGTREAGMGGTYIGNNSQWGGYWQSSSGTC